MSAALRLPVLAVLPEPDNDFAERPRTRGECIGGERPCPFASCSHHAIHGRLAKRDDAAPPITDDDAVELLDTIESTCTLDVADLGGATLEDVGNLLGVTRERVRQIEAKALRRLPLRMEHLRKVLVELLTEEPSAEARPARCGPVPASESRGWIDPSPRYAHLPGPADVTDAEVEFWCGHMGTALRGALCTRRHLARHRVSFERVAKTHPECARCADGAEIAARLGASEAPLPQREAAPPATASAVAAPAIDWMGDGADESTELDAEPLAVAEPDVASEQLVEATQEPVAAHRDVKPAKPRKPRAAPVKQRVKVVRVRVRQPEHPVVALVEAFAARARKVRRA